MHLACIQHSSVDSLFWYLSSSLMWPHPVQQGVAMWDYLSSCTSNLPCSIVCPALTLCFLCSAVSVAQHALFLHFLFTPLVCGVHHGPLWEHDGSILMTLQLRFTSRTQWFPINYPLDVRTCRSCLRLSSGAVLQTVSPDCIASRAAPE